MWPLNPPALTARDSYDACVRNTKDEERRNRLLMAGDSVEAAGDRYRQAAQQGILHELDSREFTVPGLTPDELVRWVYENGMVGSRDGRALYEQIRGAAPDQRCPLCGHGVVKTLDHFLPKRMFPALCVDPLNLVPACTDCNHIKGEHAPTGAETTLLHPYLDRIDEDSWLDAQVVHNSPSWVAFFVSPPPDWAEVLVERTRYHFTLFTLAEVFALQANRTVSNIRYTLTAMLAAGGSAMVRDYLASEAETRLVDRPNGWEGVTYRALAHDDAFCSGAFAT
ncbi:MULTISPECIES: HNH endonuclease [Streptomyces]|uniref:HNH endonuclease signature motif containing protein n=2 Tax=Streptomyces TaxID=1883 RepID=A0ABU4K2Z3_9ACTN|nr:HNH endonuclease signature motif containing protein [Streptomyces roseolus]MDX2291812.1 HNH endonuclease signature motif containing protein [Streptomyces roseolus]